MWLFNRHERNQRRLKKQAARLGSAVLDQYGAQVNCPRLTGTICLGLIRWRESDAEYRPRLAAAMEGSRRYKTKEIIVPEGPKVVNNRYPAGYIDHLKRECMDRMNPEYLDSRWGTETEPNPDYDPDLTFEEARDRYIARQLEEGRERLAADEANKIPIDAVAVPSPNLEPSKSES